jgi:hypothetical protein
MNIIKVYGIKNITSSVHKIEMKSDFKYVNKETYMVVLSEDDIKTIDSHQKLRGYRISCLLLPKKYKYTITETEYFKYILPTFDENITISYY